MTPDEERKHLVHGAPADQRPSGAGLIELIVTATDANAVLTRARAVLRVVLDSHGTDWPDNERCQHALPEWFRTACAPELSEEQAT